MTTIHKYVLKEMSGDQELQLPTQAKFVHCDIDKVGEWAIWCLVNTGHRKVARTFRVFATGEPVTPEYTYLGAFLQYDHQFVWHVFEKGIK
jgi:hypothetical protein